MFEKKAAHSREQHSSQIPIPFSTRIRFGDSIDEVSTRGQRRKISRVYKSQLENEITKNIRETIEPVESPHDPFLVNALHSTRKYLTSERKAAGLSDENVSRIIPVYAKHKEGLSNTTFGETIGGIPFVFVDKMPGNSTQLGLVMAHELSHAAVSEYKLDADDNLDNIIFTYTVGFDRSYKADFLVDESDERKVQATSVIYSAESFMEDEMAQWDALRTYNLLEKSKTIPKPDAAILSGVDAFNSTEAMERILSIERILGKGIVPTRDELVFFALQSPTIVANSEAFSSEIILFTLLRGISQVLGQDEAKNLGKTTTNEEAIEMGRRILQKGRLTYSDDVQNRLARIFGEEVSRAIFSLPGDKVFEAIETILPSIVDEKFREA